MDLEIIKSYEKEIKMLKAYLAKYESEKLEYDKKIEIEKKKIIEQENETNLLKNMLNDYKTNCINLKKEIITLKSSLAYSEKIINQNENINETKLKNFFNEKLLNYKEKYTQQEILFNDKKKDFLKKKEYYAAQLKEEDDRADYFLSNIQIYKKKIENLKQEISIKN